MKAGVFKQADIFPHIVRAGDSTEFVVKLVAGPQFSAMPCRLLFDFPAMLGMSRPSLSHREDHGFLELRVSNPDVTHSMHIWDVAKQTLAEKGQADHGNLAQRMCVADISAGIEEDDIIELRWGAISGGFGPGCKVTTVVPTRHYAVPVHIRYFEDPAKSLPDFGRSFKGNQRPTPDAETVVSFQLKPCDPHHIRVIRHRSGAAILIEDIFHNIVPCFRCRDFVSYIDSHKRNEYGICRFADPEVRLVSLGLPITETARMDKVFEHYNIYWGDMHTHSAFSGDSIEREKQQMTPDKLMRFARHRSFLDFFAVTDHHQPWDIERNRIGVGFWNSTMEAVLKNDVSGEFLVFPGFEYRCPRGDTVALLESPLEYDKIDRPEWTDVRKLWKGLRDYNALCIPHFHNPGELPNGEWWECPTPGLEPALEIFSCHGSYEREDVLEHGRTEMADFRVDRSGLHLLQKGLHYALIANSDDHKGRAGINGITAVFAKSLDKASIMEAYRARRVYGATNARIKLVFAINGSLMGSILPNTPEKTIRVSVTGENNLKKVEIFRDGKLFKRFILDGLQFDMELTERDEIPAFWYVRVLQKDNHMAWSSPIWFE